MRIGDVNKDGIPDLVVANKGSDSISILRGTGNGQFSATTDYPAGHSPQYVALADLNGDGFLDVVVANYYENYLIGKGTISVLLNDGTGGLLAPTSYIVGTYPASVAIADFNGDGKPDLAVVSTYTSNLVEILLGDGSGAFALSSSFSTATGGANEVVAADLNGDGIQDLALVGGSHLVVFLGRGDGAFGSPLSTLLANYLQGLAVGDVDEDGIPDLVAAAEYGGSDGPENRIWILHGVGDGTFQALSAVQPPANFFPLSVALADIDGDGHLDVVATVFGATPSVYVWLGEGAGNFVSPAAFPIGGSFAYSVAVGDLNHDGQLDLVATNLSQTVVLLSASSGPLKLFTLTPCRIVDTRGPTGILGGPELAGGSVRVFPLAGQCAIPTSARAVSINSIVVDPNQDGSLTIFPDGINVPGTNSISFRANLTRANNAIYRLGHSCGVSVFPSAAPIKTHFVLDVTGYFE